MPETPNQTTGEKIKSFRVAFKVTQKDLAEVLGIGQSRLSEIEQGQVEIGLKVAKRFCAIFPITLESLVCPNGLENDEEVIEIRKRLKKSNIAI